MYPVFPVCSVLLTTSIIYWNKNVSTFQGIFFVPKSQIRISVPLSATSPLSQFNTKKAGNRQLGLGTDLHVLSHWSKLHKRKQRKNNTAFLRRILCQSSNSLTTSHVAFLAFASCQELVQHKSPFEKCKLFFFLLLGFVYKLEMHELQRVVVVLSVRHSQGSLFPVFMLR